MTQYIVMLLDDTAVSFCHYENKATARRLMPIDTLRQGVRFAMMENLNVQFVYPDYPLPKEYLEVIDSIDHTDIKASPDPSCGGEDCVKVISSKDDWTTVEADSTCVLRLDKQTLFGKQNEIADLLGKVARLNVVINDVETFTEEDFGRYKVILSEWAKTLEQLYVEGKSPQLNLLTDRMMLDKMNNCGAGDTTITLAPDGRFYVCPAFYHSADGYAIGDLVHDLDIKNAQLYRIDHAPICRHCDAYQCKRCVWLNRKTTLEVNTPSHEQCVVAHLERNASRGLLLAIRRHGMFLPEREITEIDYLDPFEKREQWTNE